MAEDYLAKLPEKQVAGWYRRLADRIALEKVGGQEPLAATLLRAYVDNRDPAYKYREVFLTKKRARFTGGSEKWAGVLPRLQGWPGFQKWDGRRTRVLWR
jgi:hypothetical protein